MDYLATIVQLVLFPGLVFTAVAGLVTTWIDRKVTARVQMRVGPPFLQPFYDIAKYLIKETTVPAGSTRWVFLLAPLVGFAGVLLASMIIWNALLFPHKAFVGDLIVVLYLLTMPSLSVILGAFASRNPVASLGGSREMKLVMAYELPFVLAILVPVIKAHSIGLGQLATTWSSYLAPSGILSAIVAIVCMQAKLTLVPFDQAEAETELAGGACLEYSGPPLAIFKLTRAMMQFVVPMFLITVFFGGLNIGQGAIKIGYGILKYIVLTVIIVLIRNTAPRLRIDQAVRFFWGPVSAVAAIAVVFALLGW